MFLQGDKPSTALTRDRASRVLFDGDDSVLKDSGQANTLTGFSNDHNPEVFQQLVKAKYPQASVVLPDSFQGSSARLETETAASLETDVTLSKYYTADTQYETPSAPAQKYYNNDNPIPIEFVQNDVCNKSFAPQPQQYHTFKPKVWAEYEDIEVDQRAGNEEIDEALLQKIDEVQVSEPKTDISKASFNSEVDRDVESETYLRLNAKGLIACVTFIAVTLLIVLLVIINSIAINSTASKIQNLRDENTALMQQYNEADAARSQAFESGEAAANSYAQGSDVTPIIRDTLPPVSSYPLAPANPDASTNFFDKIAEFFNSIFG